MKPQEEVIEKLKGKQKFIVLSYDYDRMVFDFYDIYSEDENKVWEIVEEEISSNYSKEIVLNVDKFKLLKEKINKFEI